MTSVLNRWTAILGLAVAAASLGGCAAAVVGGAAVAGGVVATDRRSPNTQVADQTIELRASSRVNDALGERRGHINITSYYRKVLLTGEVATTEDRQRAYAAVAGTPDVVGVIDELAVLPESSLSQRANDTYLTGRVKAGLLDANGVPANSIKVLTERGTTYLMGRLTPREADLATEVARTTPGVQRVVRVIDFISEQAALHPSDPTGSTPAPAPVSSVPSGGAGAAATPAAEGAVTHPVTPQPVEVQQPPIQVQPLPPASR
ncbi:MAG TPA: BON domain-containing protein [Ottowia sp.]|uniref:BON domain-containing protein n=1 Tax=Ottowia sp. TaxID=1898956 RepID=UPI002C412B3D|nr:BON domain-containing protein [Ottowia sp.]HMN20956.1 BON domain-containing protein [Ottowia sp.]